MQVLDGAEAFDVEIVAVAGQQILRRDAHALEVQLCVRNFGNEARRRHQLDAHARCRRRDSRDAQRDTLAAGSLVPRRDEEQPAGGPEVVQRLLPSRTNPAPSRRKDERIARGVFPSASVTQNAAILSSGSAGTSARSAA